MNYYHQFCWAHSIAYQVLRFYCEFRVHIFLFLTINDFCFTRNHTLIFCRSSNNVPRNNLHLFESLTIIRSEFAFGCTVCFDYIVCYFSNHNYLVLTINLFRGTPSTFVQAVFLQTVAVYMCHLLFESLFSKKKKYINTDQSQMTFSCTFFFFFFNFDLQNIYYSVLRRM